MNQFYTKMAMMLVALVILSIACGFLLLQHSEVRHALLPAAKSTYPWTTTVSSDAQEDGASAISIKDDVYSFDFDFSLSSSLEFPYAAIGVVLEGSGHPDALTDWSGYSTIELNVMCRPRNVLAFVLHTLDEEVTDPHEFQTYRTSTAFFSCDENWSSVEIDLRRLDTPEWWLKRYGLDLSKRKYQLNKVKSFSIVNSEQSPVDTLSTVKIRDVVLLGQDRRFVYAVITLWGLGWGGFIFWALRQYSRALLATIKEKMKQDRPLVAYQQLPVETKKDKVRSAVLHFMATEYADSDLSLEKAVASLAINRAKLNDILKEEVGLTFNVYLNKLRLSEAARLLSEKDISVAEIAYAVGYSNVSYFNRIFKNEYGCTPKSFKKHMASQGQVPDTAE